MSGRLYVHAVTYTYFFHNNRSKIDYIQCSKKSIIYVLLCKQITLCLIWRDDHVCRDEERPVLRRRHHVVRGVPDPVVQGVPVGGNGLER